jgi:exopolysaccharide production protein ExoQ
MSTADLRILPVARVRSLHDLTYWLLLVLLFTVPWTGVAKIGSVGTISRAWGIVVAGMAALTLLVEPPQRRFLDAHFLAIAYTAWGVASYYWSIEPQLSLRETGTAVQVLVLLLLMWEFAGGAQRQIGMMTAYVAGTSCTCVALLWHYIQGYDFRRYALTGTHPNDLAFTASLAIPLAWYLAEKVASRPARMLLRLYVPLAVVAVLLTASRSALFTTSLGLLMLPLASGRRPGKQLLVVLLVAGSLLGGWRLLPDLTKERVSTTQDELMEGDWNGRKQLWTAGLQILADHPLIGVGTQAVRVEIEALRAERKGVHNTYLSVAVEEGSIGLALFLLLLLAVGMGSLEARGLERRFAAVLFTTFLIGLIPRQWQHEKVTWIMLGLLLGQTAAWRQLAARPGPRLGAGRFSNLMDTACLKPHKRCMQ